MKLDRNVSYDGKGKYALINLRTNQVLWGYPHSEHEFFVIKLKDKYASAALFAYARAAEADDPEYAADVRALAQRAHNHPNSKQPD